MRFVTVSNLPLEDDSNLSVRRQPRMLRESAAYFGVTVENICPLGAAHDWTGRARLHMVLDYLRAVTEYEPVLLTDAWDSFFAGTPAEMEAAFRVLDFPVVISAECNLWPPETGYWLHHPTAPTRFRYACGGGWCGYAGALREMFAAPDFWPAWAACDQAAFDRWVCRRHEAATLDYHCRLFQCMFDDGTARPPLGELWCLEEGRLGNRETGSFPLVWHGGGAFAQEALTLWDTLKEARRCT